MMPDWVIRELGLQGIALPEIDAFNDNVHVLFCEDILYSTHTTEAGDEIDLVAVERAINGRPVELTRAERAYAIRVMTDRGHSANDIAARFGTTERTVQRWRAAA